MTQFPQQTKSNEESVQEYRNIKYNLQSHENVSVAFLYKLRLGKKITEVLYTCQQNV